MQFVLLFLAGLQVICTVNSFQDLPANVTENSFIDRLNNKAPCNKCTVYENPLKNTLSRRKRSFVFYKGTVVVITNVMAKAILPTSPRGLIQSNECDLFYEVPYLVEGWRKPFDDYVTRLRADKKSYELEVAEDERLKNIGVVNASAIPLKEYYAMSYPKPTWDRPSPVQFKGNRNSLWNSNRRNFQGRYRRPYNQDSSRRYYPNSERRNYVESRMQNGYYAPNRPSSVGQSNRSYRVQSNVRRPEKQTNNATPTWHHHREYRERRDIYDHLEKFGKMIGKNLRKCILRAICEMKQQLTPVGESFINDVARILFTVPTNHDNKDDEFTQMALEDNVDCARRFMVTCPHSPLEYFFTNFRPQEETQRQRQPTAKEIMTSLIYA